MLPAVGSSALEETCTVLWLCPKTSSPVHTPLVPALPHSSHCFQHCTATTTDLAPSLACSSVLIFSQCAPSPPLKLMGLSNLGPPFEFPAEQNPPSWPRCPAMPFPPSTGPLAHDTDSQAASHHHLGSMVPMCWGKGYSDTGCPHSCPQPHCSISGITLDSFLCSLTLLALTEIALVGGTSLPFPHLSLAETAWRSAAEQKASFPELCPTIGGGHKGTQPHRPSSPSVFSSVKWVITVPSPSLSCNT